MLIIFLLFTTFAVGFWGWFRFEDWRGTRTPREKVKVG
jgi:hypothetical protein